MLLKTSYTSSSNIQFYIDTAHVLHAPLNTPPDPRCIVINKVLFWSVLFYSILFHSGLF